MLELAHRTSSVKSPIELTRSSIPSASEKELGELERHTETAAFDRLILSHRRVCMKWAWLIMHNENDAQDAVQNAFRKAFQCRDQFKNSGTFAAWLHRIVKNECLMRLRKDKNARFVYLDNLIESNTRLELVGSDINPEDQFGRIEVANVLRKEMLHMPPLFRNIMMLYEREQLSMPVVAKRLGLSVPAARSRLLRARRELCSRLGKHCGRKGPGTLLENAIYSRMAYARAS